MVRPSIGPSLGCSLGVVSPKDHRNASPGQPDESPVPILRLAMARLWVFPTQHHRHSGEAGRSPVKPWSLQASQSPSSSRTGSKLGGCLGMALIVSRTSLDKLSEGIRGAETAPPSTCGPSEPHERG